ncbi:DUF6415 family natural product biosynthesis protein [Streptomyces sp. NPDC052023]|uniref:DUF6415 family natural product biosynthesis protein n=1 Tax=Streptomyces sp. NPDC052023 TaxID=3365681 RepID=UPI0037CF3E39
MTVRQHVTTTTRASSGSAPIDVPLIRDTCERALWGPALPPGEDRANLVGCLRGHARLLLPEVEQMLPRMQGEHRRTAEHVITSAGRALDIDMATAWQAESMHDLATAVRALLTLHDFPGPLDSP